MTKNTVIFFLGLIPLIPISSNFAFGMLIVAEIWFLVFANLLANTIATMLNLNNFFTFFSQAFVVIATCIFDGLIGALFPILELSLRLYIFILSFSYILILSVDSYYSSSESFELVSKYSLLLLITSLIRELLAFGSISLPGTYQLFTLNLFPVIPLRFFGSTAGTFLLVGVFWLIHLYLKESNIIQIRRDKNEYN